MPDLKIRVGDLTFSATWSPDAPQTVAAFKAMRAGKHVLTEKLMGQTVSRCKEMGRLTEESKAVNGDPIVFAVGH